MRGIAVRRDCRDDLVTGVDCFDGEIASPEMTRLSVGTDRERGFVLVK